MTNQPDTPLDKAITNASATFVAQIASIASGDLLRDGIVKAAVNEVIWTFFHEMPDQRQALVEVLEDMERAVGEAAAEARGA